MRFALGVEYDGSGFCGWQRQPGLPSVQEALETALSGVAGEVVGVVAAGRTDRGVHASGQVVHFDSQAERPLTAWVRGSNALLPPGIAVLWAHPVPEAFHARFSALSRSYQYLLLNHSVRNALMQGKWGWFHQPLDVVRMREAAQLLLGKHDFSAFRASGCQAKTPVKTLGQADISSNGPLLQFSFTADAFLLHMVRNMVGALVAVGAGRAEPGWIGDLLASGDRTRGAPTFPPDGLYFTDVDYADNWQLPRRATRYHGTLMQPDAG